MGKISANYTEKPASEGFKGQFTNLRLSDLIQMSAQGHMSLILGITHGHQEGKIYIKEGEIIHAAYNNTTGIDAFFEIMSWKHGDFQAKEYSPPPVQSITLPWEHLLIEAHRWMDEKRASATDFHKQKSTGDAFNKNLSNRLKMWGESHPAIIEIGVFSADRPVPFFKRDDTETSLKGLEILRTNARLSQIFSNTLGIGSCREFFITGSTGTIALFLLDPDIQIYIYIDADISQKAIFRLELDSLISELRGERPPSP